jgi:hypothetical protein
MSLKAHLKKGTVFKFSTVGNNGFYYPDDDDNIQKLDDDTPGSRLPWIKFNGLSAYLVESSYIKNRKFLTKNTVIWLDI